MGCFGINQQYLFIEAIIFFVQEFLPEEEHNIVTVVKIFDLLDQKVTNINNILSSLGLSGANYIVNGINIGDSIGHLLFEYARKQNPYSLAVRSWDKIYSTHQAENTWGGIMSIVGAALSQYSLNDVQELMATNQIDFQKLLQPKNAFFILYDDANVTKNFISNSFYTQLFSYLYEEAYKCEDQKLPVKIRFYLDDFKNITIPHFADYLSTARSRNMSICMMLQDESQLRAKYGNDAPSIIGNCSAYLLTGTIDLVMAKDASERFDLTPRQIRMMAEDNFLVDISGYVTKTERYDYHSHPNYIEKKTNINSLNLTKSVNEIMDWKSLVYLLTDALGVRSGREPYWKKAQRLSAIRQEISDVTKNRKVRLAALDRLRHDLDECIKDKKLNNLTKIYRDTIPDSSPNVGYDTKKVDEFISVFCKTYPKPSREQ